MGDRSPSHLNGGKPTSRAPATVVPGSRGPVGWEAYSHEVRDRDGCRRPVVLRRVARLWRRRQAELWRIHRRAAARVVEPIRARHVRAAQRGISISGSDGEPDPEPKPERDRGPERIRCGDDQRTDTGAHGGSDRSADRGAHGGGDAGADGHAHADTDPDALTHAVAEPVTLRRQWWVAAA